jgi:hypothetical protein
MLHSAVSAASFDERFDFLRRARAAHGKAPLNWWLRDDCRQWISRGRTEALTQRTLEADFSVDARRLIFYQAILIST